MASFSEFRRLRFPQAAKRETRRESGPGRTHAERPPFLSSLSWDIRHFGQVPRRGETTTSDSRVITSDIGRKAARTRPDEHRNLPQWALGPALH